MWLFWEQLGGKKGEKNDGTKVDGRQETLEGGNRAVSMVGSRRKSKSGSSNRAL